MKFQLFAARPLLITFFVALSNVPTALGETPVTKRHDEGTPTPEASASPTSTPPAGPTPSVRPSATVDPKVAAIEALRFELQKLSDQSLLDVLNEGPKAQDLDRKKLEEALKRVPPFDADKAKDELLRARLLDTFQKAVETNVDQKGENLISLLIADILRARRKITPTPTVTATVTTAVSGTPATGLPGPTRLPTPVASVTPTIPDLLKALQEQLKKGQDDEALKKALNDKLAGSGAGAGAGAGSGAGEEGAGGGSGSGDSGQGSGGEGSGKSDSGRSASKDSKPDAPSNAKNETKNPPEIPPLQSSSKDSKKDDDEKKPALELAPKKANLFGDTTAKPKPVAAAANPSLPNPADVPVRAVPPSQANLGPSEAIDQAIPTGGGAAAPVTDAPVGGGGPGNFGNGIAGNGGGGGGGSSLGGDDVLRVGNFPSGGGGGGGPYTYIKTGPGDWLQGGGGGGSDYGPGPMGSYDEEPAAKTVTPAEQILRLVPESGGQGASGGNASGGRGLSGSGGRIAGRGVFSRAPTVGALCADAVVGICANAKVAGKRLAAPRLGR